MSEHYYDGRDTKQVAMCDMQGRVLSVEDHYAMAALTGILANPVIAQGIHEMKANAIAAGHTAMYFQEQVEFPCYAKAVAAIARHCMEQRNLVGTMAQERAAG